MNNLMDKLKLLPTNPGCYLMKDKDENIIYVGKAKNLKSRVRSYFTGSHNYKTSKLVSEIFDFEIILTNSEQESLILELNLIKNYRPKYNIVFIDDKTYPFIEITKTIPPTIRVVRTKKAKGKLFGPYPNAKSAKTTARFLELLFPMGRIEAIPNFYEEIGSKICSDTKNNYQEQVKVITKFLKGDTKEILKALEDEMTKASETMMYERAAVIRDQIEDIKNITEKQIISINDFKDRDIIGISYNADNIALQILFMRSGRIVDQHQVILEYVGDFKTFILSYLTQFYENFMPDELLFDNIFNSEELKVFKNAIIPKIGDKRKIVELARKNATYDLENHYLLFRSSHDKNVEEFEALKNLIDVKKLDVIEIFDNSQLFGTAPISAMVVFEDGKFNKKLYRKYHLKTSTNDDYQSMREVIYRRYQRLLVEGKKMPDLILVDGGLGQLNVASEVLNSLGINISIAGLKKNDFHQLEALVFKDKVFYNNKEHKNAFKLLNKFSEEVHRYAITFHKQTRKKVAFKSPLDQVKGLGSVRKKVLLSRFDSLEGIYNASFDELRKLRIPESVIRNLKDVLKDEINS